MRLTDRQWENIKLQLSNSELHEENCGKLCCDDRAIFEGILWILRSGASWTKLPSHYPPRSLCYNRFQAWNRSGTLFKLLKALADDLIEYSELKLNAKHVAALFPLTRKKSTVWAPTLPTMAHDLWAWQTLTIFSSPSTWQTLSSTKARWLRRYVRDGLNKQDSQKPLVATPKQPAILLVHPHGNSLSPGQSVTHSSKPLQHKRNL